MKIRFDRDPNVIWINETIRIGLEFKLPDMWIGAFWKTSETQAGYYLNTDIWICLVPTLPIHIIWHRKNQTGRRLP